MNTFGKNMKKTMKDLGITQKQLSDSTGITEVSISRYVNGTRIPGVIAAVKIAEALHTTIENLVKG